MHAEAVDPKVPMPIAAEAAAWIVRLHGAGRSRQMERECLEWQARSQAHQSAFERCTATWEDVGGLPYWAASDASLSALLNKWGRARS
jgi:transmembrane sensor